MLKTTHSIVWVTMVMFVAVILGIMPSKAFSATGMINIASLSKVLVAPNSSFVITGDYELVSDLTPSGSSPTACYSPPGRNMYFDGYLSGTLRSYIPGGGAFDRHIIHAYWSYEVDGGAVQRLMDLITYTGPWSSGTHIGNVIPFNLSINTAGMVLGSSHTATVFIDDVSSGVCNAGVIKNIIYTTTGPRIVEKNINFTIGYPNPPTVSISLSKTQVFGCDTVTGTAIVTDPVGAGGTGSLTLPDGLPISLNYTGSGGTFPISYPVSGTAGTTLNFSGSVTSSAGVSSAPASTTATVVVENYTATLSVNPSSVERGVAVQGVMTVSSASTCPVTGSAILDLYGQTQTLFIGQAGDNPFTFSSAAIPAGSYQVSANGLVLNGQNVTASPAPVTITEISPTVTINLNKTQVFGCETLTGSVVVSDASAKDGTGSLTLPDGNTLSLNYTGGGGSFPLSYPVSGTAGTALNFSGSVTNNAGVASNQATATADVIAGGLNVSVVVVNPFIEPNISWCKDPKKPKCRRFQATAARSTPVNINVTDPSGLPVVGASISLAVERASVRFGGHDHDAATTSASNRTLGSVSNPVAKGQGLYVTTYTATELAAEDHIRVRAKFQSCSADVVSPSVTSRVFGLSWLQVLPPHVAIGGTTAHHGPNDKGNPATSPDNNHWVTLKTNSTMNYLMTLYSVTYGAGIYVNDASLPFGGKFDVNGRWVERDHKTHRRGIDIDTRLYDTAHARTNETVKANFKALEFNHPDLDPLISYKIHSGNTKNRHLHIYFW